MESKEKLFKTKKVYTNSKGHSIYHLIFKSRYEMGMFFLRYQEFYESINPEYRGNGFCLFDYISWYVQYTNKQMFTYTKDFIGYNLPSDSILNCMISIPDGDKNKYDYMMMELITKLGTESNHKYYVIGSIRKDITYHHELAHALYYLEPEYKKEMDSITNKLSARFKRDIFNILATIYPEKVFNDELQAYLGTRSWMSGMDKIPGFHKKIIKYEKVFENWFSKIPV